MNHVSIWPTQLLAQCCEYTEGPWEMHSRLLTGLPSGKAAGSRVERVCSHFASGLLRQFTLLQWKTSPESKVTSQLTPRSDCKTPLACSPCSVASFVCPGHHLLRWHPQDSTDSWHPHSSLLPCIHKELSLSGSPFYQLGRAIYFHSQGYRMYFLGRPFLCCLCERLAVTKCQKRALHFKTTDNTFRWHIPYDRHCFMWFICIKTLLLTLTLWGRCHYHLIS